MLRKSEKQKREKGIEEFFAAYERLKKTAREATYDELLIFNGGKELENSNEAVANAQVGDTLTRKDGTEVTLTQGDIDWAKGQGGAESSTPDTQTGTSDATNMNPAKEKKQESDNMMPSLPSDHNDSTSGNELGSTNQNDQNDKNDNNVNWVLNDDGSYSIEIDVVSGASFLKTFSDIFSIVYQDYDTPQEKADAAAMLRKEMRGHRNWFDLDALFDTDEKFMNGDFRDFLNTSDNGLDYKFADIKNNTDWHLVGKKGSSEHREYGIQPLYRPTFAKSKFEIEIWVSNWVSEKQYYSNHN